MTTSDRPGETTVPAPELTVSSVFSIGKLNAARMLVMAAATPAGDDEPVALAAGRSLGQERPDVRVPVVADGDIVRARPGRRYSLLRIRGFEDSDGSTRDVVVIRGELDAVLTRVKTNREDRTVLLKNADLARRRGYRVLAIASGDLDYQDRVREFRMEGFVSIRPEGLREFSEDVASAPGSWARVNLWSVSVRYQHWLNVAVVFILSCTGYYIMDPFFGPVSRAGEPTGYLMGWMRLIHFSAAFVWLVIGATRLVLAFTSRDRYLRWPTLWPLKSREDVRNLGEVLGHYAFIKKDAPLYLAHNPLQQLAYTGLYLACAIQMATGFVLYGMSHQDNPVWQLVSTPIHWFGIAPIRLFHACVMFGLWAFVIMHVYLAVRADSLERHGGISAMLNGGVWVRRGSKPVDAPEIG